MLALISYLTLSPKGYFKGCNSRVFWISLQQNQTEKKQSVFL